MEKRFIILIDFSEFSANILKYAGEWASQANAELLLLHETQIIIPALANQENRQEIIKAANDDATAKLITMSSTLVSKSIKVSWAATDENLLIVLNRLSMQDYENLIFLGLKGTSMLKNIFLGSFTLEIINKTSSTIVAIPQAIFRYTHEKIYVAVTDNIPLNTLAFFDFLKFIDPVNTSITFFYLAKTQTKSIGMEKTLQSLVELFATNYNTDYAIYESEAPFDDIKRVINNTIDEILVVQRGSRLLTDMLFRKFLINELVYEGETPLIILP